MKKYLLSLLLLATALQLKAQFATNLHSDAHTLACGGSTQLYLTVEPEKSDYYTPLPLYQVYFFDSATGFIIGGGGIILKTTDHGKTWTDKTYNPLFQPDYWLSIGFTTPNTGFILSVSGILAKTTDGGETWEIKDSNTECFRIKFIDERTGFMLGNSGRIRKTTDGGENWYSVPSGTGAFLRDIAFINDSTGFIVGYQENYTNTLLKTTNRGETWAKSSTPNKLFDMFDISFFNDSLGFIHANDILKTTDGGENWSVIENLCYSPVVSWDENTSFYTNQKMWMLSADNVSREFFYTACPVFYMTSPDNQSLFFVTCESEIYRYIKPLSYHWEPSTGLSAVNIPNPIATPLKTTTYTVAVEAANGEVHYDSITIFVEKDGHSPDICKITVDSLSEHYQIMWNNPGIDVADSVYLYKEGSGSDQFTKIAAFSASQSGQFVDTQSDANVKPERYALSMLDKCAFESDRGIPHRSIHLTMEKGINDTWDLAWEPYEGLEVFSCNIYRGSAPDTLQLLASLPGIATQYTEDKADPVNIYYRIEAYLNTPCDNSASANASYSNMVKRPVSPEEEEEEIKLINNPVTDHFSIPTALFSEISSVAVIAFNGNEVRTWNHPATNSFDISDLDPGIFLVKIAFGRKPQIVGRKLIKL